MVPNLVECDYTRRICFISGGMIKCRMPSDTVSLVTTGLGVSVLAGILSGVCYVVIHGLGRKKRGQKKEPALFCEICGTYVDVTASFSNNDLVTCLKCSARVCTAKCSVFIQHRKWICKNCLRPAESWFKEILKVIQPEVQDFRSHFNAIMSPDLHPKQDLLGDVEKKQVREFIEKLVNSILGENVDSASVSMLYSDSHYLPVTGQSPCTVHAALKQLIERLLKDAANLPLMEKAHDQSTTSESATNKTYEDLLATAIINKVITTGQNNQPSSSAISDRTSTSSRKTQEKQYFFGEETLDAKWKTTDLDTTSVSSLEEWLQSESSYGSRKYVDKVTLMIKKDIEEEEYVDSENEEDDAEYFRSSSSLLSDSDSNWLLQRRQFQGAHSPVPVPMLVPNPSTDAKVLIGDRPLDDTSDLSDIGSDFEDSLQPHTTHSVLVRSKNIIGGGKSSFEVVENGDVQSESSTDSGVKEIDYKGQQVCDVPESSKTDISLDDDNVEDSSLISIYSHTEKEAEYTEKYASLPRQIEKISTYQESQKPVKTDCIRSKAETNYEGREVSNDPEFIGGNYSKKEKEKWKNAIEMKNNPYSPENIERRLRRSNSAAGSVFGSDYYARLAGKPSGGGRIDSSEINVVTWFRPESAAPTPIPAADTPPGLPDSKPPLTETDEPDIMHRAFKAEVISHEENSSYTSFQSDLEVNTQTTKSNEYRTESMTLNTNLSGITSDSDLSSVNLYDVKHAQVVKKSKNEEIHIPIKSNPVTFAHKPVNDDNNNSSSISVQSVNSFNEAETISKSRVLDFKVKYGKDANYNNTDLLNRHQNVPSVEKPMLGRHLSQSSLLEDSFDVPPKVLHQKKDNTLISKIYKDPKVRLFAQKSREETAWVDREYINPTFESQQSFGEKIASNHYTNKSKLHNDSDDSAASEYESGKTGKISFFSSEEDLISLNSELSSKPHDLVATRNKDVKLDGTLYIEDFDITDSGRAPSPSTINTSKTLSTRKFIYGSQEDLLSTDEVGSIPRRKDNTLISKIYKNPNVREFALKTHGDIFGYEETLKARPEPRKMYSSDDEHFETRAKINTGRTILTKKQMYSSYDDLSSAEISLESHSVNNHDSTITSLVHLDYDKDGYKSEDLEIDEIAKQHVVRQALERFSKSEINIRSEFRRSNSLEGEENVRVSVRDLKKKFESKNGSNKPVISSLTARSLSKQVKSSLKQ